jgi:Cd2+/Zn2+-exporting ATPase
MIEEAPLREELIVSLQVTGITCLDCAAKFEKAVNKLPGVDKAVLNMFTGKLIIVGAVDLAVIRKLGREENYQIVRESDQTEGQVKVNWELRRTICSGILLVMAYGLEKIALSSVVYIALYVAATVIGGWGNFSSALRALPRGNLNMSVLMGIAVLGAFAIGQYEEGASVAFLYSISELLEAWTLDKARQSIRQLMDIAPKVAKIRRGCEEMELLVEQIAVGDVMIIQPGEKIALDGVILTGHSAINQAAINGESLPADKGPGNEVYAGTLNTHGSLEVTVTKLVQDTTIAKIIQLVEEAQNERAPAQSFVESFAKIYTPIVMVLAIAVVFIPPLFFQAAWEPWIYRGLALLVVACPCALVISTPVAIISAISNAAKNGVLIKGGIHLEQVGSLAAIAFDKTGTLTKGQPIITDILPIGTIKAETLLALAASLEARSEHPLATAIIKAAEAHGCPISVVENFSAITGRGVQGTIAGQNVYMGNLQLFRELSIASESIRSAVEKLQAAGKTAMIVGTKESFMGIIAVADEVREVSAATIAALKRAGIKHTIMLTGDNSRAAQLIADQIGIDEFRAELLPKDKALVITELLSKYGKVAMIGDGINDAPALALSTVGLAMGGAGTDTALETADIVLMADDLTKLPFTIRLSRKALRIIRQNISGAVVIKVLAVLAVFPGWLTLWLAIVADMGATLVVTLNSMRLLKIKAEE